MTKTPVSNPTFKWERDLEPEELGDAELKLIAKYRDPWQMTLEQVGDAIAELNGVTEPTIHGLLQHPHFGSRLRAGTPRHFTYEILPGYVPDARYVRLVTGLAAELDKEYPARDWSVLLCVPGTGFQPPSEMPTNQDFWKSDLGKSSVAEKDKKRLEEISFEILPQHRAILEAYYDLRFEAYDAEPTKTVPVKRFTSMGGVGKARSMWAKILWLRQMTGDPTKTGLAKLLNQPWRYGGFNLEEDKHRFQREAFLKARTNMSYGPGGVPKIGPAIRHAVTPKDQQLLIGQADFTRIKDAAALSDKRGATAMIARELAKLGRLPSDRDRAFALLNGNMRPADRIIGRRYVASGKRRWPTFFNGDPRTLPALLRRMNRGKRIRRAMKDNKNHDQLGPRVQPLKAEYIRRRHGEGVAAWYLMGFVPYQMVSCAPYEHIQGEDPLKKAMPEEFDGLVSIVPPTNKSGNGDTKGIADDMACFMHLVNVAEDGWLGPHFVVSRSNPKASAATAAGTPWGAFLRTHTLQDVVNAILAWDEIVPPEILLLLNGDNHIIWADLPVRGPYCIPGETEAFSGMVPVPDEEGEIGERWESDDVSFVGNITHPPRPASDPLAGEAAVGKLARIPVYEATNPRIGHLMEVVDRHFFNNYRTTVSGWAELNKPAWATRSLDLKELMVLADSDRMLWLFDTDELDEEFVNTFFLVMSTAEAEAALHNLEMFSPWWDQILNNNHWLRW